MVCMCCCYPILYTNVIELAWRYPKKEDCGNFQFRALNPFLFHCKIKSPETVERNVRELGGLKTIERKEERDEPV
jgi:hypothetical protein